MVLRSVLEANKRRRADGVAHEHRREHHGRVHDDAVGRHAVLADEAQQLPVVQDAHHAHGDIGDHLRGAVGAGLPDDGPAQVRAHEVQGRGALAREVHERHAAADELADVGGQRRADEPPAEHADEQQVEQDVRHAGRHDDVEAVVGLARRDEEALEGVLQDEERHGDHHHAAVERGLGGHLPGGAQKVRGGLHEEPAADGEHRAHGKGEDDEQREVTPGPGAVALAQGLGHKCAAAGADHYAHRGQNHHSGKDQVHGGKGRLAREVGHEKPVHDGVARGEDHHGDGGQRELDERAGGEMLGHIDGHGKTFRVVR